LLAIDGKLLDEITEADLETDFEIKVRLHRVKILKEIIILRSDIAK
jgi:hypothetical protein